MKKYECQEKDRNSNYKNCSRVFRLIREEDTTVTERCSRTPKTLPRRPRQRNLCGSLPKLQKQPDSNPNSQHWKPVSKHSPP